MSQDNIIEIKAVHVFSAGDPSVGIAPAEWVFSGPIMLDSERDKNDFIDDLKKLVSKYITDIGITAMTAEEIEAQERIYAQQIDESPLPPTDKSNQDSEPQQRFSRLYDKALESAKKKLALQRMTVTGDSNDGFNDACHEEAAMILSQGLLEFVGDHYIKLHGGWCPKYGDQRKPENLLKFEDILHRYKVYGPHIEALNSSGREKLIHAGGYKRAKWLEALRRAELSSACEIDQEGKTLYVTAFEKACEYLLEDMADFLTLEKARFMGPDMINVSVGEYEAKSASKTQLLESYWSSSRSLYVPIYNRLSFDDFLQLLEWLKKTAIYRIHLKETGVDISRIWVDFRGEILYTDYSQKIYIGKFLNCFNLKPNEVIEVFNYEKSAFEPYSRLIVEEVHDLRSEQIKS